ncbi:MAG: response regulator [Deltaproteobacteria bacterium]|nr:MAG: response regulator [Deltaproteobacteria bacterium]
MKFLVVDDEPVSRKKMEMILSHFGQCETTETGRKAVDRFHASLGKGDPFDLITLDISMPDMDGITALLKIREAERMFWINSGQGAGKVKIMMVTAHAKKDIVLNCIKAGADDYVVKPFDREIVSGKLQAMGIRPAG